MFNATVVLTSPLVIRRDAETEPLPITPDSLVPNSALAEGDRVMVLTHGKAMVVIGKYQPQP